MLCRFLYLNNTKSYLVEQPQAAVDLMLSQHKWETAIQVLKEQKSEIVKLELFHTLFAYCFKQQQYLKLNELFEYVPTDMNVFDMLKLFSMYVQKDRTTILAGDPENDMTVKIVKEHLLKLFNK